MHTTLGEWEFITYQNQESRFQDNIHHWLPKILSISASELADSGQIINKYTEEIDICATNSHTNGLRDYKNTMLYPEECVLIYMWYVQLYVKNCCSYQ